MKIRINESVHGSEKVDNVYNGISELYVDTV